jgi:Fe-S cluster assembly iron-binding protein IscA
MIQLEVTDSALKQLTEVMKENIDKAIRLFVQGIG